MDRNAFTKGKRLKWLPAGSRHARARVNIKMGPEREETVRSTNAIPNEKLIVDIL